MLHLPKFSRIERSSELDIFAANYLSCSGFNVPRDYYENNQVFAVALKGRMIGGFVLGSGDKLRTLEVFSGAEHREALYQQVRISEPFTEMCCFWIDPACRKKTGINFFVWGCVAYALQVYGNPKLIFGTNSVRLAALYSAAPKARLIHIDFLNQKQTFVFTGPRKKCLQGIAGILLYKVRRLLKIAGRQHKISFKYSTVSAQQIQRGIPVAQGR